MIKNKKMDRRNGRKEKQPKNKHDSRERKKKDFMNKIIIYFSYRKKAKSECIYTGGLKKMGTF